MTRSFLIPAVLLAWACNSKPAPAPAASTSAELATSAPPPPASAPSAKPLPVKKKWFVKTGPVLAVVPGQGIGPIGVGARVETVERHMDLACQDRTPDVCRYVSRAVEFQLKEGKVHAIHLHRAYRPAGPDRDGNMREYGLFNGALPPDLQLGMFQNVVADALPKPTRTETVKDDRGFGTVELHHHPGMTLEFDRVERGVVLGGIVISKK